MHMSTIKAGVLDKANPAQNITATAPKNGFTDLLTQVGQEAINSSKNADYAMSPNGIESLNHVDRAQIFSEATLTLKQFKTVFENVKESFEKIINLQI